MKIEEGRILAERFLCDKMPLSEGGGKFLIVEEGIIEDNNGWYFPYQTEKFIKTKDLNFSVVGNAPIFVARDGRIAFRMFGAPFHPAG